MNFSPVPTRADDRGPAPDALEADEHRAVSASRRADQGERAPAGTPTPSDRYSTTHDRQVAVDIARPVEPLDIRAERFGLLADEERHRRAGLLPHRRLVGAEVDAAAVAHPPRLHRRERRGEHDRVVPERGVDVPQRREQVAEELVARAARFADRGLAPDVRPRGRHFFHCRQNRAVRRIGRDGCGNETADEAEEQKREAHGEQPT